MKNLTIKIDRGKLIITADLTQELGPSSTGKSTVIASTFGNPTLKQLVEEHLPDNVGNIRIGLNVYRPNRTAPRAK